MKRMNILKRMACKLKRVKAGRNCGSEKACNRLNNQGFTLLTIIICIAFISVLGAMVISSSMTNMQMKKVDMKAKESFYAGEVLLDKFRLAVQETVAEAIRNVYEKDILVDYAEYLANDEGDRNRLIQKMVIAEFLTLAGGADRTASTDERLEQAATGGYVANMDYFTERRYLTVDEMNMISAPMIRYETDGSFNLIRLKDVKINYIDDSDNYRTGLSTDIVVDIPRFSYSEDVTSTKYSMEQPYKEYVLMADGRILSQNLMGSTNITGNVYAAEGLYIDGLNAGSGRHTVNISGKLVATDRDITVADTATLNINRANTDTQEYPLVWAENLITLTGSGFNYASQEKTSLNINGISLIRDDLSLEGKNSNVSLKGAYIGYTGSISSGGSSMIINGSNSRLDLSGLKELVLAGRANISIQNIALNRDITILTGESLAVKSNQRAYLLPGKFIQGMNHNPLTEDDLSGGLPAVVINDTDEQLKFNKYISKATPYKMAANQTGDTVLRYYYLNFNRGWKADAYFLDFFNLYKNSDFFNGFTGFTVNEILLPDNGDIHTAGNLTGYDAYNGMQLTPGMSSNGAYKGDINTEYDDISEAEFDNKLNNAIAGLVLNKSIYAAGLLTSNNINTVKVGSLETVYRNSVIKAMSGIRANGVSYVVSLGSEGKLPLGFNYFTDYNFKSGSLFEYKNSSSIKKSFWIIDGNVSISGAASSANEPVFNGILIASGDITINDNARINGIIISTGEKGSGTVRVGHNVRMTGRIITKGDIYLGRSCELYTDDQSDEYFDENIFSQEVDILRHIFKNSKLDVKYSAKNVASDVIDLTKMIYYENWKRFE